MELILWRHAEAKEGEPDLRRKLTSRGEKQARRVAVWLDAQLPESARVLVSPAVRAQQTAQALATVSRRKPRTVDELAPGASIRNILDAAQWPRARVPVVVVGHQPELGHLASFLLAGESQEWSIKKGAVWWISSRERGGSDQAVLRAVISPDLV
jgi:phosphohistidine phosphatase